MLSTTWTETMLRLELTTYEYDPTEFDLPAMLTRLNNDNDVSWFDLVHDHHVARQTSVACPDWCTREQGHLFMAGDEPGAQQSREHTVDMAPAGVAAREDYVGQMSITVTVPELRDDSNDSTISQGNPSVWLHIEGSFDPDDVHKLSAALLAAADKAREVSQ
ncbi:hypothetical protein SAMN03159343_0240 [Klenkia marina]|uniref:Uncharacterized protein n=1 Tax=Klenkia marina TaxID=1960309 RepID=A0A1G4XAI6_9ACTN|nr:hypothetical protein [Klenkia marina]SCX37924.1 hypothetical protein SAMN03159343_0240 [Klenkia marina]